MVRPLSKELQKIAIDELHENPERIEDDIKHMQEWVNQQPHLNAPTDKQWILVFLRGCKFSLQTTKEKFDFYYSLKNKIPELMKPRDIYSTEIQAILKAGLTLPLPYPKNYVGPRVLLGRFHNYDKSIMNLENTSAVFLMILTILMIEDDNFMVSGVLFWTDNDHYPLSLLFQLTPTYLKNIFESFVKGFPVRIKGFLETGSPAVAQILFNLAKACMGEKLRNRVHLFREDEFENIFKIIPKNHIPKEYGGENCNLEDITAYWIKKVESYSTWFEESNLYITNEALRPQKPASLDDEVGIDGSFRKLNID